VIGSYAPWRRPSEDRWTDEQLRDANMAWKRGDRSHETVAARRAWDRIMSRRRRDIGATMVPTRDVLRHIGWLRSCGLSVATIGEAAGLSASVLPRIVYPGHCEYTTGVHRATEARVLAVRPDPRILPPDVMISGVGTRRRIQAALWMGWTMDHFAAELGYTRQSIARLLRSPKVLCRTASRIADIYDRLSMTPGPSDLGRRRAIGRGFAPPLAWDDDTIDDPAALPDGDVGPNAPKRRGRRVDLDEVYECACDGGTTEQIAATFGVTRDAITVAVRRHKRTDIRRCLDVNNAAHAQRQRPTGVRGEQVA
jgi:hypothetical protein